MKEQINLVTKKVDTKKNVRKFFLVTFILFCITFFISAALLLSVLVQNNELSTLATQKSQLESTITSQKEAHDNAALLKERLSQISKILSSRFDLNVKLTEMLTLLPPTFGIKAVEVSKEKVSITMTSPDLNEFDTFLDDKITSLNALKDVKDIKRIDLAGFRVDKKTAEYSLTLSFDLGGNSTKRVQ